MVETKRWEAIYPLGLVVYLLLENYTVTFIRYPILKPVAFVMLLVCAAGLIWGLFGREWWRNRSST